ncbi:hypothetical protein UFOVP434_87 [uncultured Caudovirales phage]|uniref:Uncharacterized protein n=1 Tax=uncultured Caudovirales phage TaxID=2100421 RepID=A0A6J5MBM7_9CAUD|nr:hypothetical protein UFOVP434_87 [uncultured Caudovirales phage]
MKKYVFSIELFDQKFKVSVTARTCHDAIILIRQKASSELSNSRVIDIVEIPEGVMTYEKV